MKIGIIGCGNMGQVLLKGLIARHFTHKRNIFCCDIDRKKANYARLRLGVRLVSSNSELIKKCRVIILAVKPQDVNGALKGVNFPSKGKLLISICAGITTQKLEQHLGKVAVVRVMPNMPAQIAQAISAISLGKYAQAQHKKLAVAIFSCIGEVVQVQERLMNAVTAISGSGPAYFFYLTEKLIETAKKLGIPERTARTLAVKTALGSAMLMNQSKESAQTLRSRVSSKGGTTEAAFGVFRKGALENILRAGFHAASKKAKKLEQSFG